MEKIGITMLLAILTVQSLMFSAMIYWGVMPLADSLGADIPFWPTFITAWLIRLLLAQGIDIKEN